MLQILKLSIKTSHFTTKQPSVLPNFLPAVIQRDKTSQITSSVPSDQYSGSPSFAMGMNTSPLQIITAKTLTPYVPSDKPSEKISINPLHHPTGLPSLVPSIQASDFPTHVTSV